MAKHSLSLLCVSLVGLGHAVRRVVRNINDASLELSYVEVDGRGWKNDYEEDYWIAKVYNGMVSMTPPVGPPGASSKGESIGTPYDDHRVFNLYGAWSDAVPSAASRYIETDRLYSTLQLYGAEYYHMHVETLPKLVLGKKLLEADPDLKILCYRPKPYARRFLQLLNIPEASLIFVQSNPARYGDTACGIEGRCVDYRAKVLFIPSPAHQFSPSGQVLATTRDYVYSLLAPLDTRERTQIVVLSRKNTATRRWVNEEACVLALRAAFPNERVVVYPDSGLPSDEMVRLFARAKVVLGPHGGGFASIMFAPKDATVIEVDCAGKSIAFREVARQMGQPYIGLRGNFTWESRYLQVPAQQLVGAVRSALQQHQFPAVHLSSSRALQQQPLQQQQQQQPQQQQQQQLQQQQQQPLQQQQQQQPQQQQQQPLQQQQQQPLQQQQQQQPQQQQQQQPPPQQQPPQHQQQKPQPQQQQQSRRWWQQQQQQQRQHAVQSSQWFS